MIGIGDPRRQFGGKMVLCSSCGIGGGSSEAYNQHIFGMHVTPAARWCQTFATCQMFAITWSTQMRRYLPDLSRPKWTNQGRNELGWGWVSNHCKVKKITLAGVLNNKFVCNFWSTILRSPLETLANQKLDRLVFFIRKLHQNEALSINIRGMPAI